VANEELWLLQNIAAVFEETRKLFDYRLQTFRVVANLKNMAVETISTKNIATPFRAWISRSLKYRLRDFSPEC
jgi:hypothetical protein